MPFTGLGIFFFYDGFHPMLTDYTPWGWLGGRDFVKKMKGTFKNESALLVILKLPKLRFPCLSADSKS
jgi:hypothetical protein